MLMRENRAWSSKSRLGWEEVVGEEKEEIKGKD